MSAYDWLLFLHVASAFAMVAAYVVFTVVLVAGWRTDRPTSVLALFHVTRPAGVLIAAGALGTLVFGVWLAIYVDGYELWDAWILGALVLWAIGTETGRRAGTEFARANDVAARLAAEGRDEATDELRATLRSRKGLLLYTISTAAVLGVLALMMFKPGA